MQITRIAIVSLFLSFLSMAALAEVSVKGTATVNYKSFNEETKQDAIQKAKINALDRYYSEGAANNENYSLVRPDIVANVDNYVLGHYVLEEEQDKKGKSYRVTLRVDLNAAALRNKIEGSSRTAQAGDGEKSTIAFIFVAREQASATRFRDKVYEREETTGSSKSKSKVTDNSQEGERVRRGSVTLTGSADASTEVTEESGGTYTSGGSVTTKGDAITWKIANAEGLNGYFTGAFANAGFEVGEAEYVLDVDSIRKDFSSGDDLSGKTKSAAVRAARENDLKYLAYGTLDIGVKDADPASGLTRVFVTVAGKVLSLKKALPTTVASVPPMQFSGLGPNETVARNNALKAAAEGASKQLVDEMNNKDFR